MMMEPMDEFFKKKMEGRDLPFNEAHWEGAQQLLDDRDARRVAAWWWRAGLLTVALSVVVFLLLPPYPKRAFTNSASITKAPVAENKAVEPPQQSNPTLKANSTAKAMPDTEEESNATEPETIVSSADRVKKMQGIISSVKISKPAQRNTQGESPKSTEALFNERASSENTPSAESASPPVAVQSQGKDTPERGLIAAFAPIPIRSFEVGRNDRNYASDLPDSCWPVRKRWSVQTILGGSLPAQGSRAGALLGLGASWPGRDGLGLYIEGLYRSRLLSSLPTQASLQRTYGFGVTENAFELTANSLHYVDVNAGATYALGRHQLHAGAGATYLVGARGQLERTQKVEAELDYGPVSAISEGWIAPEGLSRWLFRAQAGYGIEVFPNLQLSGRVQYSITPVLSATAPEQPRLSPLSFDLMLKYNLW